MFQAVGSIYINGTWENIIFPSNLCLTSMSTFANIGNTFRQWACDIKVGKKLLEINLIVQRQSASNDLSIFKDFFYILQNLILPCSDDIRIYHGLLQRLKFRFSTAVDDSLNRGGNLTKINRDEAMWTISYKCVRFHHSVIIIIIIKW